MQAEATPAPDLPPPDVSQGGIEDDLDRVDLMLRDYRSTVGENPVGTNAEIMAALLGDNIKQVRVNVAPGSALNDKGELVDRWGTPYFFHQLSATQMEIRSAGEDRQMHTLDDRSFGSAPAAAAEPIAE